MPDRTYLVSGPLTPAEPEGHPSVSRDFPLEIARVTTRVVARWADRYALHLRATRLLVPPEEFSKRLRAMKKGEAAPYEKIQHIEEGALPASLVEREALIEGFFIEIKQAIEQQDVRFSDAGVSLFLGEQILLEQGDSMPGPLAASPEEFAQLQVAWEQAHFPRDLYYPVRNERTVMDGLEIYGGVVRAIYYYSPRQWEQRLQAGVRPLPIPSEEERLEAFIAACDRFAQAVALRMAELAAPGQTVKPGKLQQLKTIYHEVSLAALRAREALLPTPEEPSE